MRFPAGVVVCFFTVASIVTTGVLAADQATSVNQPNQTILKDSPAAGQSVSSHACVDKVDNATKISYLVCSQSENSLRGLHWGMGILYSSSRGGVGDVSIVQQAGVNTVRVNKSNDSAARAAFELHYFLDPMKVRLSGLTAEAGIGPFVSLNSKPLDNLSGSTFSSVGLGLMIGANAFPGSGNTSHSINFGVGWMVDTDVKRLAVGVYDGQATTIADKSLLVRSTTSQGFMALLSYNFAFK